MKVVVEYWVGAVVATREHLNAQIREKDDGGLSVIPWEMPPEDLRLTSTIKAGGGPYGSYAKGVWRYYHYELEGSDD